MINQSPISIIFAITVSFLLLELLRKRVMKNCTTFWTTAINEIKEVQFCLKLKSCKWAGENWNAIEYKASKLLSNLMRSLFAIKSTMQCPDFISAKNEEMTKHPFFDKWSWCTLENTNALFDNFKCAIPIVHFQYSLHISDTLPTFLIRS